MVLLYASHVEAQTDEPTTVKFYVEIYDVNLTTDTAQVNITVTISKLVTANITPAEPIGAMIAGEIDNVRISCNKNIDGDFVGSSGITSWSLGGDMGKGEYFPFERYELTFRLATILPMSPNMSTIKIRKLDSFAYFKGAKKAVLSQTFKSTPTNYEPAVEMGFPEDSLKAVVYLNRNVGESILWLLIAPTVACSYVLISTMLLYRRRIMHRLTVYISLLVFGPSFLMAIQSYLPFRINLSIPEVLVENLIISTAIFGALSLLRTRTGLQELTRDEFVIFFSFFSCSYILNHFHPLFPSSALPVFSLALSPYLFAVGILMYRSVIQLAIHRLDWQHYFLAYPGIVMLEFGFFFVAFYFGAYLAVPGYTLYNLGIVSLAIATIGLILVALSGALNGTRRRLLDDGVA